VLFHSLELNKTPDKLRKRWVYHNRMFPRRQAYAVTVSSGWTIKRILRTRWIWYWRSVCRPVNLILIGMGPLCRSRWPCGQMFGSGAARLLGLWVRMPPEASMSVSCECLCCQVEASASGWSLAHRSPTEGGVSECDREASILRGSLPTRGFADGRKKGLP
jgi:hypothetical protein